MRTPILESPQDLFNEEDFIQWLTQARGGSRADLGKLLECFRQYMLLIAETELGTTLLPKVGASDVVQESMLEAGKNLNKFNGNSREEMRCWLYRITLNNIIDLVRKFREAESRQIDLEESIDPLGKGEVRIPADTDSPPEKAQEQEDSQQLLDAIARMPIEYQKVVKLRYYDDRSWEDIGCAIGKSAEAARKVFGRAIDRLRVEMNVDEQTTVQ